MGIFASSLFVAMGFMSGLDVLGMLVMFTETCRAKATWAGWVNLCWSDLVWLGKLVVEFKKLCFRCLRNCAVSYAINITNNDFH